MTSITLNANGASLSARLDGELTAGMAGIPITIAYDHAWDGLTKNIVFYGSGKTVSRLGIETDTTVAPEVMVCAGSTLSIGLEGRSSDGSVILPTVWAKIGKIQESANVDADPSAEPTPEMWAQFQAMLGNLNILKTGKKDDLVKAINEVFDQSKADASLSLPGRPADAKATGMEITQLKHQITSRFVGRNCKLVSDKPINFDFNRKKIIFPNTYNTYLFWGDGKYVVPPNLEIDLVLQYGSGFVCFDTATNTFKSFIYSHAGSTAVKESYLLVFAISANKPILDIPHLINGKKGEPQKFEDRTSAGTCCKLVSDQPIDIDFVNQKITFPHSPNTIIYWGYNYYVVPSNTQIPLELSYGSGFVSFDTQTKTFKSRRYGYASPNYMKESEILVFAIANSKVYIDIPYTVNGKPLPLLKNGEVSFSNLNAELQAMVRPPRREYIDTEIETKCNLLAQTAGEFKFAFMTDIHDHPVYRRDYKIQILNKIAKTGMVDMIVNGGDFLGYETKNDVLKMFQKYNKDTIDGIQIPYILLKGNHDTTGNIYSPTQTDNILSDMEWFNAACRCAGVPVVYDADHPYGGYFYYDFEPQKIRIINLNTSQINMPGKYFEPMAILIQQSQIDWLQHKALNFMDKPDKTRWSVIILSHAAINPKELGGLNGQHVIEGILHAFMTGSTYQGSEFPSNDIHHVSADCDFSQQGPMEFICSVHGHMHYDRVTTYELLNRPCISVGSAKADTAPIEAGADGAVRPPRASGTISEELADLISIDMTGRVIHCIRFGAGSSRNIPY